MLITSLVSWLVDYMKGNKDISLVDLKLDLEFWVCSVNITLNWLDGAGVFLSQSETASCYHICINR